MLLISSGDGLEWLFSKVTGCNSHIMAFGGRQIVLVVTFETATVTGPFILCWYCMTGGSMSRSFESLHKSEVCRMADVVW